MCPCKRRVPSWIQYIQRNARASLICEKGMPKKRSPGLNAFYCVLRLSVRALNLCRIERCIWACGHGAQILVHLKSLLVCVCERIARAASQRLAANSGAKAFRCRLANRRLRRQLFLCTVARIFIGWRLLWKCQKKDEHKLEVWNTKGVGRREHIINRLSIAAWVTFQNTCAAG